MTIALVRLAQARSGLPQLMSSDKHNSRMARARDLISSLINVASSRDVPFHQLQQLQCLHHGAIPLKPFVPHSFFTTTKVTICTQCVMASVEVTNIAETLLTAVML